jgi:formate dehydrogenase beta subunit
MKPDRRTLLKGFAAAAGAATLAPVAAEARERRKASPEAVAMLYDSTLCIGCKACVVSCKEANDMPADTRGYGSGLYDAPEGLNENTLNIIQVWRDEEEYAFVKKQCMHCVDPACVSACMLHALQKDKTNGVVTWAEDRCVGCRYCQVACPFGVPQFEFASLNPKIVKCEFCQHRFAEGKGPACVEVCPREAVIFGKRDELLNEARRRLLDHPDRYEAKIYGEHDLGGTQVLYLSPVPFANLGFRFESEEAVPQAQQTVQEAVYRGFIAPVALYAALGVVMIRNRRANAVEPEKDDLDRDRKGRKARKDRGER